MGAPIDLAGDVDEIDPVGAIPVRNIWLLFLYAYDLAQYRDRFKSEIEESPDLKNLIAKLLSRAVEDRLRRKLNSGYVRREAVLRRLRGRIDLLETLSRQLLSRGAVSCRFEELTSDTPRNRLIRAALARLAATLRDTTIAQKAKSLAWALGEAGVSAALPSRAQLAQDQIGRHDAEDRLLVSLARAVFDLFLPTEGDGSREVFQADRASVDFPKLYERAIGGFFTSELRAADGWQVFPSRHIKWPLESESARLSEFLPGMICDIVLENRREGRRIVIDTKFMNILTPTRHGVHRFKSANIFQVYSYLRSQEADFDPLSAQAEGMLLHPAVGLDLDETAIVQGHPIRFKTIDLGLPTDQVLNLLGMIPISSVVSAN